MDFYILIKDIQVAGVVYNGRLEWNDAKPTGADRDSHGCIRSAGYSWCDTGLLSAKEMSSFKNLEKSHKGESRPLDDALASLTYNEDGLDKCLEIRLRKSGGR